MPDLQSIIETQKMLWGKRYTHESYHPWKEFIKMELSLMGGHDILNRKIPKKTIQNSKMSGFNKEIVYSLGNFLEVPTSHIDIGNQYLWGNQNIPTPNNKTIDYKLLKNIGINYVKDLITDEKIITLENVNVICKSSLEMFNLKSVIKCLPTDWKNKQFDSRNSKIYKERHEKNIQNMTNQKIYKSKIKIIAEPPTSECYFSYKYGVQPDEFKEYYSVPFSTTIYTKLRSFQFKISHNILFTNEKLFRIGLKQTDKCNFCKEETETLSHLFAKFKHLWKKNSRKYIGTFRNRYIK